MNTNLLSMDTSFGHMNEIAFAMTFKTEPQAMVMSFMHNYGERYDWLCKLFKDWAFLP